MEVQEHFAEILRDRKLKATSTRLELLTLISEYGGAIPFSEIQRALHEVDRVTLYRTIHTLTENGIIHKAFIDDRETFYAICSDNCTTGNHNHNHVHFKCLDCLTVTCIQAEAPVWIDIPGHTIDSMEIEVTGLCADCRG